MSFARFLVGDVFAGLATLDDDSADLIFSSPPFLALRSYLPADHPDKAREIGSEQTPADYLDALLDVVDACGRVLAPHGSLCFELGDTYSGVGGTGGDEKGGVYGDRGTERPATRCRPQNQTGWPLDKSLTGIPTLFAWSLAYGRNLLRPERTIEPWRIRNLVPWCRPNPPVGALGDKWRPATSYVTVATRARDRWFDLDAVRTEHQAPDTRGDTPYPRNMKGRSDSWGPHGDSKNGESAGGNHPNGAPPLDFMVLPTAPYRGAHYATFPPGLVTPFVRSMCPREVCRECGVPRRRIVEVGDELQKTETARMDAWDRGKLDGGGDGKASAMRASGFVPNHQYERETVGWTDCEHGDYRPGVCLDPFAGSGTTLMVATGEGRDAVGIDLDPRNADLTVERLGMFVTVETLEPAEGAA